MHCVYIITNKKNGTLYIGVTRNLLGRMLQHKSKKIAGFATKYGCDKLIYYEEYELVMDAIQREKHMKNCTREWKMNLIEKMNPKWADLAEDWSEEETI
jgi:putative endonuclease